MKVSLDRMRRRFDAAAPAQIDFADGIYGEWSTRLYQSVLNISELRPSSVVLELGCGTGRFAHGVAPHVTRVVAVDASPAMIALARDRDPDHSNLQWLLGDLRSPPHIDGLNNVVMIHALRYLDEDERMALFVELFQQMLVGGLLVLGDLLWSIDPGQVDGVDGWLDEDIAHVLRFDSVSRELADAGFVVDSRRHHPALGVIRGAKVR